MAKTVSLLKNDMCLSKGHIIKLIFMVDDIYPTAVYASSGISLVVPNCCVHKICISASVPNGYVCKIYITARVPNGCAPKIYVTASIPNNPVFNFGTKLYFPNGKHPRSISLLAYPTTPNFLQCTQFLSTQGSKQYVLNGCALNISTFYKCSIHYRYIPKAL